ncbi:MAG: Ig-like domain-containing protein [Pirellulaceae bacterium]|nr:Ig-like domain-containing protein [Pirellulaceae bacterium]
MIRPRGSNYLSSEKRRRLKGRCLSVDRLEQRLLLAGDLTAHWLADDLSANLQAGTVVTEWIDSVADLQSRASGSPTMEFDPSSGRALVRFNGNDGVDTLVVDSRQNPLSEANDFSVVVVFRTDDTELVGGDDQWFHHTGIVDANRMGFGHDWGLSVNALGQVTTGMGGGFALEPRTVISSVSGVNDGRLHTAIVTRSGATLTLSVDDQEMNYRDDAPSTQRSNLDLTFGALAEGRLPFHGDIAQVRLYNGALNRTEIVELRAEIDAYYQNTLPQAHDDTYELREDALLFPVNVQSGVLANDWDLEGDPLTAELISEPKVGTVALAENGSFVYTAPQDFFGIDRFTYAAKDHRSSPIATVSLNVLPSYDSPQPVADTYQVLPGELLQIPALIGLLANDGNPDRVNLTVSEIRPVNAGTLSLNSDGAFVYDSNGFEGAATFAYQIHDGTTVTGPVEVTIGVNTPPISVDDHYVIAEDGLLVVDAIEGVISNDLDPQTDNVLSATLLSDPKNGTLELKPDGSFFYAPNAEYSGVDTFEYKLFDGFEESEVSTVTIRVQIVDDPPTAAVDRYFALPGQVLAIAADTGLLSNDFDMEGQSLAARLLTRPANGTVVLQQDGSFVYEANTEFEGRDTFSYVANDGVTDSEETFVFVQVAARPVVISEFLAVNSETVPTRLRDSVESRFRGVDQFFDWIEIQNLLDVDLDISGIYLTDDVAAPMKWEFPAGSVIPTGEFLVVFASGLDVVDPLLDERGLLHANFKIGNQGEYLGLTNQSGTTIDRFENPPEQLLDISYGRLDEQPSYFAKPTPGEENLNARFDRMNEVAVDPIHGFYDSPIQVTIASEDPTARIRYTLDGSEPTEDNGNDYTGPISISSTTTLRATAWGNQSLPAPITTHSYLFLADIMRQSPSGDAPNGWPDRPVRGQVFDYGMDPAIVNDPTWGPQLSDALTQIPSVSIVLGQDDLTGKKGIYVNPTQDGRDWERPASVELVYPDGTRGFQIDAGLRIRGGFSRGGFNPKHSFRLFFRDQYEGVLNFPLFDSEGTDEFRAIDLRTAQNYAWSNDTFNDETRNSFLRDIFSRDLQREIGQPYTRGRYYHLYLNGQYWGLYQTEERPEASFAETYLGGEAADYDVIKASGGTLQATDGELQPWRDLWEIAHRGFESLEDYFLIQGKNPDGSDNLNLPVHVQVDNVIDFAINYMFTGNQDMPTSLGNASANNFWAIRNPNTRDGWQFVAHDNEHNMLSARDDQTRDDPAGRAFGSFNPKYLHQQLDALPEYQLRFADRIQKHFFNGGAVTRERAQALMQARVEQINTAIVAESARWGDQHNEPPLTKDTWRKEVDWLLNTFLGQRTQVVLNQFRKRGLYPSVEAPQLNQHGGLVDVGFSLEMATPTGVIYYTLDGEDPREIGGAIGAKAREWLPNQRLDFQVDTRVMARVWTGAEWSALSDAHFQVGEAVSPIALRISEVHYHPLPASDVEVAAGFENADDFEFIELVNTSEQTLDLGRAELVRTDVEGRKVGVDFDFAAAEVVRLEAGERVVVVEDRAAFEFRYGTELPVVGQWSGRLSNAGELLTLLADGQPLQQFSYDDEWYPNTDGGGRSLEILDPANPNLDSWKLAASWRASSLPGGSPGRASRIVGDVNNDGVFNPSDLVLVFQAGKYEDHIPKNAIFEEGDWNGDGDFNSNDLVLAFQVGAFVAAGKPLDHQIAAAIDALFAAEDDEE